MEPFSEFEQTQKNEPNIFDFEVKNSNKIISRTIYEKKNSSEDDSYNQTVLISPNLIENCKSASKEGEFIKAKELPEISEEAFEDIKKNIIVDKQIENFKQTILNSKYEIKLYAIDDPIAPIMIIEELIESYYNYDKNKIKEMKNKFEMLNNYPYFRRIKGDGNCYYRAVIFKYFETIILNKDIKLFRNIIYDIIFNCFFQLNEKNNQEIKNFLKVGTKFEINTQFVSRILMII